jgi:hypothetical protein
MDNASIILSAFDRHLDHEARLIVYGRAAIQLGYDAPPPEVARSLDVDGLIPQEQVEALVADEGFWNAQQATNEELRPLGLYITHLFQSNQVFLRDDWLENLVPITRPPLRFLRLFRPATLDLILTKMMRGDDAQDMDDVAFLIRHDAVTRAHLEETFRRARLPDVIELHDAFAKAKPRVLALAAD